MQKCYSLQTAVVGSKKLGHMVESYIKVNFYNQQSIRVTRTNLSHNKMLKQDVTWLQLEQERRRILDLIANTNKSIQRSNLIGADQY
jgi:hypothetical protein